MVQAAGAPLQRDGGAATRGSRRRPAAALSKSCEIRSRSSQGPRRQATCWGEYGPHSAAIGRTSCGRLRGTLRPPRAVERDLLGNDVGIGSVRGAEARGGRQIRPIGEGKCSRPGRASSSAMAARCRRAPPRRKPGRARRQPAPPAGTETAAFRRPTRTRPQSRRAHTRRNSAANVAGVLGQARGVAQARVSCGPATPQKRHPGTHHHHRTEVQRGGRADFRSDMLSGEVVQAGRRTSGAQP